MQLVDVSFNAYGDANDFRQMVICVISADVC